MIPASVSLYAASLSKNGWMDRGSVWGEGIWGPKEHYIRQGSQSPTARRADSMRPSPDYFEHLKVFCELQNHVLMSAAAFPSFLLNSTYYCTCYMCWCAGHRVVDGDWDDFYTGCGRQHVSLGLWPLSLASLQWTSHWRLPANSVQMVLPGLCTYSLSVFLCSCD